MKNKNNADQPDVPKLPPLGLAMVAILVYIVGGVGTFAGIVLWAFFRNDLVFGIGTGEALGYLGICVGLIMTILGVLLMRIFRNRS